MDASVLPASVQAALANYRLPEGADAPSIEDAIRQYGSEAVNDAVANYANESTGEAMRARIAASDLPESVREEAMALVDSEVSAAGRPVSPSLQSLIEEIFGSNILDMIEEAGEEGEKKAGESGGGGATKGNWLVLMAMALGKVAGDHLAEAIELADKIGKVGGATGGELEGLVGEGFEKTEAANPKDDDGANDRADQARATTVLQARMQAETQLFKMVFEAASTLIKTIGEGFSTMSRKQ